MWNIFKPFLMLSILAGANTSAWAQSPAPDGLMAAITPGNYDDAGRVVISWNNNERFQGSRMYQFKINGVQGHAMDQPITSNAGEGLSLLHEHMAPMTLHSNSRVFYLDGRSQGDSVYEYTIQQLVPTASNNNSPEMYEYGHESIIKVITGGQLGLGQIPTCSYIIVSQASGPSGSEPIPCGQMFVPTNPVTGQATENPSNLIQADDNGISAPVVNGSRRHLLVDPYTLDDANVISNAILEEDYGKKRAQWRIDEGYELVFSDEFDSNAEGDKAGNMINSNRWSTQKMWGPHVIINKERQYYVDVLNDDNFAKANYYNPFNIDNGILTITAKKINQADYPKIEAYHNGWRENPAKIEYLSGVLTTYKKEGDVLTPIFAATSGIFEARIRLNHGKGLFPAFWLHHLYHYDKDLDWFYTERSEIDIMENHGHAPNVIYNTVHWYENGNQDDSKNHHQVPWDTANSMGEPLPGSNQFRNYVVRWNEDPNKPGQKVISFYIDDESVATTTYNSDSDEYKFPHPNLNHGGWKEPNGEFFQEPLYMLLNLAVGGSWSEGEWQANGPPDFGEFGKLEVDWVRVFQSKPELQYPEAQFTGRGR